MTPIEMCIDNLNNMILSKLRAGLFVLLFWSFGAVVPAAAQTLDKINDTGLTVCANATSNSEACTYSDDDPSGFPRQDGGVGRSAKELALQLTIVGSDPNSKGFDFSKMQYNGTLNPNAILGAHTTATNWGCTKDNVTGLIWGMKLTVASNAQLNTNTYNWKDTRADRNGGTSNEGSTGTDPGTTCFASTCDTQAYAAYINSLNICGEAGGTNDWRLPTRLELISIFDVSKQWTGVAAVDTFYFPNMMAGYYWTSENNPGNPSQARAVNMSNGNDSTALKSSKFHVILVRP